MKKYIPNILTFINLSFGVFSIVEVMNYNYFVSAICIIAAALVDRYDGRIARVLDISSEIGIELDSLADLVSFGVAPGILIYFKFGLSNSLIGLFIMIIYVICGAYRLARYNISTFDGVFSGVPITIAGSILALVSFIEINIAIIPLMLMAICAYLMVSKINLKKF